mmetsp:Transcript_33505/g.49066  ORF Transcript_33505/g.49066 Transcript_33505/m.49066 type:complete len:152 (+) Transcript_33505:293-748(+)
MSHGSHTWETIINSQSNSWRILRLHRYSSWKAWCTICRSICFFEIWTFTCSSGGRCVWWYGIFIGDAWWKTNLRTKRLEQKGWNKNDVIDINIHVTAHGKRLEIKQERDGVVVTIMGEGKCIRQEEILFGFSVSTHRFWFKIPLLIIPDET